MKNVMRNSKRTRNSSLVAWMVVAMVALFAACSIALPNHAFAAEAAAKAPAASSGVVAVQDEAASAPPSSAAVAEKGSASAGATLSEGALSGGTPSATAPSSSSSASAASPSGSSDVQVGPNDPPGSLPTDDVASSATNRPSVNEDETEDPLNIPSSVVGSEETTVTETPVDARVITGYAVISGNTRVGSMLVAGVEGAPEGVLLQYQWYRGNDLIAGATASVYTTTNADAGFDITCHVTAQGYEGVLISGAIKPTAPPDPQAFAIYSDADKSLYFYKRPYVPNVGDTFAGKVVTAVYTGIEAEDFVASWFDHQNEISSIRFVDEIKPLTTAYWFTFDACTSMDLRNLNTSEVTTMEGMFFCASSLTTLDVSMLDTSKVTSMSWMFSFCDNLTSLDLSSWDTARVADMSFMFAYSGLLSAIDVSNFNTSSVVDMTSMFECCEALKSVDMSRWNTSNVTSMWDMFLDCSSLKVIDISSFDTQNVQQMILMFSYCLELTTIYVSPDVDWSSVPESDLMFSDSVKIVGGLGTKYEAGNEDGVYAVVDGLGGKPGYFTPKITVSYFDSNTGSFSQPVLYVYGMRADSSSLANFLGWATAPNALVPVFLSGDVILYDPSNVRNIVLYPVVGEASTASVVISGGTHVGDTLTAVVTGVPAGAAFTYQWYRDGVAITGATAHTYKITYEDIACSLNCVAVDSSFGGTLVSNVLGPVDQEVTVVYWSYTDAHPNELVIVHTETARLSDLFNYKFDQNADEDSSNDYVGYRATGWWDEWYLEWFDILTPESEFATTIGDIARLDEWDGVSPINMYGDTVMRVIEVTYFANGFELENGFDSVCTVAWVNTPYCSGLKWHAHKLVDQRDDKGHSIDSSMTCGYILTELLETPWADKLNIHLYWEEIDYKIVFVDPNGRRTTTHFKWADTIAFPDPGTYPGREFLGWFTEQDGSGTQATEGMTYALLAHYDVVEQVTLYSFFRQLDLTGTVQISGDMHVGNTLVATVEGKPADAQLVYQWYRGDKAIAGATKPTYLLISVDVGNAIKCEVSDANYAGTLVSNVLGPIAGIQIPAGVFAVYAHEDKSLTFYNRESRPSVGDVYEGKTVTAVYADFEADAYEGETVPWHGYSHLINSVLVADEGIRPVSTANWFFGLGSCTSIDIRKLDTSLVTSMAYMFASCSSLADLKLGDFDTSNVTNMKLMFGNCRSLEQLDVSGFDTSNVLTMESMFNGCQALTSLDVSSFDTSKVTNTARMFFNCKGLTSLDLGGFDTSSVTDMSYMFYGCEKLVSVSLPRVGASSSIDLGYMFSTCPSLVSVDLSVIDFSKVSRTYNMFFNCAALEVVDLGNFAVTSDTEIAQMFYGCSSLSTIFVNAEFEQTLAKKTINMFKGCTSLVGGNGTAFDANKTNGTYACIDGRGGKPGYFTPKITVAYYDPSTGMVSTPIQFVYGLEARTSDLADFTGWALAPDATKAVFLPGEVIVYDPANVRDIVLYPVVGAGSDPADRIVTVEYWSLTDESPADYVIVHTMTAKLSDLFDPTFNQNADDDPNNDTLEYVPIGWWDANYYNNYSNALSADEPRITLEELATLADWDGVGPIVLYADLDVRMITVYLDYGGYEDEYSADPIFVCGWAHVPFNSSVYWQAHRFKGVFDDKGNQLDDSMNCAYILTELLEDPWSNTLNIHYVWEKIEYQVHFIYPNGVTTSQDVEYVEQLALPTEGAGFEYPGYEFVGWFTAVDGGGQQVMNGATYASVVRNDETEELNLYAYFRPVAAEAEVEAEAVEVLAA